MVSISPSRTLVRSDSMSSGLVADINVLQFSVSLHRREAQVAAETALLESAEGGFDMDAGVGVDADHAALDSPGNPQRAIDVAGPERCAQAVRRIVYLVQHLVFVIERADAHD